MTECKLTLLYLISKGNNNRALPGCSCARLLPPEHHVLGVGRSQGLPGPGSGCYGNQQYRGRCPPGYWAVKHSGTGCRLLDGGEKHVWNKHPLLFLYYLYIQCNSDAVLILRDLKFLCFLVCCPWQIFRLPLHCPHNAWPCFLTIPLSNNTFSCLFSLLTLHHYFRFSLSITIISLSRPSPSQV